jgi:hypothetical protein
MRSDHHITRANTRWGSYGKPGAPDYGILRYYLIKDIHDDHLEKIIPFIQERMNIYSADTLITMFDEQEYRQINKIRIPFKFG